MKTFIEFGFVGKRNQCFNYVKEAKLAGYKTIVIDLKRPMSVDEEYYKLLIDETYINYWSDSLDIPLADKWVCYASLEHTQNNIVNREVEGIANKVRGSGEISIDMSEHSLYINRITYNEWFDIISKYFNFKSFDCDKYNEMIYFRECVPN